MTKRFCTVPRRPKGQRECRECGNEFRHHGEPVKRCPSCRSRRAGVRPPDHDDYSEESGPNHFYPDSHPSILSLTEIDLRSW